jgi:hypothetical protein
LQSSHFGAFFVWSLKVSKKNKRGKAAFMVGAFFIFAIIMVSITIPASRNKLLYIVCENFGGDICAPLSYEQRVEICEKTDRRVCYDTSPPPPEYRKKKWREWEKNNPGQLL